MKNETKTLLVLGAAGGLGLWWVGSKISIRGRRLVPPGFVSTQAVSDASGRIVATRYVYPPIGGVTRTFTLPLDEQQAGYLGVLA